MRMDHIVGFNPFENIQGTVGEDSKIGLTEFDEEDRFAALQELLATLKDP